MDKIDAAFKRINRKLFVDETQQNQAEWDIPLPIGYGQTISQPSTVKFMLEMLEVEPGNKIMDIGSGSGWTTALLSYLTGTKGWIYAVEIIPELLEVGRNNCQKAGIQNASFFLAGSELGLPQLAPFDRILVSAAADELPKTLLKQLKIDGKIVLPVKNDILEIVKISDKKQETFVHPGFAFVPLIV